MTMKFRNDALRATIISMNGTREDMKAAAYIAVLAAGEEYLKRVRRNMSLRDHTPNALAREGHPYARRGGSIGIHQGGTKSMVNPQFRVHQQSGSMLGATTGRMMPSSRTATYRVGVNTGTAPHAAYVIQGTKVMLGRDVIWDTGVAPATQKVLRKTIIKVLGPGLRTQAIIRFGPVGS